MPEEIVETQQITEPKPTNRPKIVLAAVLGISLLTGAAYAGYWYASIQQPIPETQPQTRETSSSAEPANEIPEEEPTGPSSVNVLPYKEITGWPIMDTGLGFSFQYPAEFVNSERRSHSTDKCWISLWTQTNPPESYIPRSKTVRIIDYAGGSRREAFLDEVQQSYTKSVKEVRIAGINSLVIESAYNELLEGALTGVFIPKGSRAIVFIEDAHGVYGRGELENILSSIRFASSTIATCPQMELPLPPSLKKHTYTNDEAGLNFEYPAYFNLGEAGVMPLPQLHLEYTQDGWIVTYSVINIYAFKAFEGENLNTWFERHKTSDYPQYKNISNKEDTTTNSLSVIAFVGGYKEFGSGQDTPIPIVLIKKGNLVFHFELQNSNFKQVFDELTRSVY